jgi:hypothetical protein
MNNHLTPQIVQLPESEYLTLLKSHRYLLTSICAHIFVGKRKWVAELFLIYNCKSWLLRQSKTPLAQKINCFTYLQAGHFEM